MSYTLVASRYAKAIFDLSQEQHQLEEVYQALMTFKQSMTDGNDFYQFIHNPLLSFELREQVLKALLTGKVPVVLERFLYFINTKSRLNILSEIIDAFDALYLVSHNRVRGIVYTAIAWDNDDKSKLNQRFNDKFGKEILLDWKIDVDLIGGFKVLINDQLFDYSFKSQLLEYRDKVSH